MHRLAAEHREQPAAVTRAQRATLCVTPEGKDGSIFTEQHGHVVSGGRVASGTGFSLLGKGCAVKGSRAEVACSYIAACVWVCQGLGWVNSQEHQTQWSAPV